MKTFKICLRPRCIFNLLFACSLLPMIIPGTAHAQRLPTNVSPEHSKLFLDPDIGKRAFSGEETINIHVLRDTSEVVLNSLDLEITQAEVSAQGKTQVTQVTYDRVAEMAHLALSSPVAAGDATLHLKFSGKLTEGLRGIYLSKTSRRFYAVTQFEGTYARMMFPCFDEPAYKATFDLTVMADKGDTAISNGRIVADEPAGNRHKITFSISPKMSTYLVALAIGDWQCLEKTADGVPIRVCAVPEKKQLGKFALDVAAHSIEFYNRWYGIKYPFGKLDMVAIPDYEWGGMENTAAIFYHDTALLLDEATAPMASKRGRAGTIAHEIAHQWFGDLVTAAWWDDIWLNEGFATWMQGKPIAEWHPEWHVEETEAAATQQIIGFDSLSSARAIHGNPNTPGEIKEMFDGITYQKGGAVLRMLESYVGPEVFRRGVNRYLKEHANGNATSADFWRAVAEESGKPIDTIMPTFVLQPGVPMIKLSGTCQGDRVPLEIEQQRFLISGNSDSGMNQLWRIPVCLKAAAPGSSTCTLVTRNTQQISLSGCPSWLFGNRDAEGYYRVEYDAPDLLKIAENAEKQLNAPERIALVEDAWAMTQVGKTRAATFLSLVQALQSEGSRTVIDLLAGHLGTLGHVPSPEYQEKFRAFERAQFAPRANELGWSTRPGDSDDQKALRTSLLAILSEAGDPGALAAAQKIMRQALKDPESAEEAMASAAFAAGARRGDAALYDRVTAAFLHARSSLEYYRCLTALVSFEQPALVERTLSLIDQGKVREQDYPQFFAQMLANPAARQATWEYLKGHWEALKEKVSSFGGRGAVSALGEFCSAEARDDIKKFFTTHRAPGAERALEASLQEIDHCIAFRQSQQKSVEQWLDRNEK